MPQREYHFWVYILSSRSRNLYIGITNALIARTAKHREHIPGTYTARYAIDRLVYFEYFQYVANAIACEKALKRCSRAQKIELIERFNPTWEDLFPGLASPAMTWQEAQVAAGKVADDDLEVAEADPLRG
jgi:putative endonuclease